MTRTRVIKIGFAFNITCVLLLATPLASMAEPAEHGLPQKAVEIARPFGFPITNSKEGRDVFQVRAGVASSLLRRDSIGPHAS